MKKIFSSALFLINISICIALLTSFLSQEIRPSKAWIPALFGLAFPFLYIINLAFLIWWSIRKSRKLLLPLSLALIAFPTAANFVSINFEPNSIEHDKHKILTFNVRNFDLYNWSSNKQTRNKIFDFLKKENAEIVCLQEFFNSTDRKDDFVTLDTIIELQKARNYHAEYTITAHKSQNWGIATFSSFPIVRKEKISFGEGGNNICIFTDIKVNHDTIRVYNMHLASIHFGHLDYQFIDSLSEKNNQEQISGSINLLKKLKIAFIKREQQAELVLKSIQSSPHPVMVCGDFNDTPSSYTYGKFSQKLKDAFVQSGNGLGVTYIGAFPSFRIDYILHSNEIRTSKFVTHPNVLSDHYPITCNFSLETNRKN